MTEIQAEIEGLDLQLEAALDAVAAARAECEAMPYAGLRRVRLEECEADEERVRGYLADAKGRLADLEASA